MYENFKRNLTLCKLLDLNLKIKQNNNLKHVTVFEFSTDKFFKSLK